MESEKLRKLREKLERRALGALYYPALIDPPSGFAKPEEWRSFLAMLEAMENHPAIAAMKRDAEESLRRSEELHGKLQESRGKSR